MLLIVHTTGECNLKCDYCGGSFPPHLVPWRVQYSLDELRRFVRDVEHLVVAFYGGEPLLNPKFIMEVMDGIDAEHFVIQTNGLLIQRLPEDYWRRFDTILLSIDGVKELTDRHRGRGVYTAVLKSARWLMDIGYSGDLVARMVVTEDTDIYRDVTHLLSFFDYVHWQLDFVWSDRWVDVKGWLENSYKPGLKRLMKLWIEKMRKGSVLGIAPFQGIIKRIKEGGPAPPCGSGVNSFTVSTDGRILACPIAVQERWAELGRLDELRLNSLGSKVVREPCTTCEYFRECGGRCLYTYREKLWGEEGFKLVCEASKYIINLVRSSLGEVERLVGSGIVDWNAILYPPFNNTVEIMP